MGRPDTTKALLGTLTVWARQLGPGSAVPVCLICFLPDGRVTFASPPPAVLPHQEVAMAALDTAREILSSLVGQAQDLEFRPRPAGGPPGG